LANANSQPKKKKRPRPGRPTNFGVPCVRVSQSMYLPPSVAEWTKKKYPKCLGKRISKALMAEYSADMKSRLSGLEKLGGTK